MARKTPSPEWLLSFFLALHNEDTLKKKGLAENKWFPFFWRWYFQGFFWECEVLVLLKADRVWLSLRVQLVSVLCYIRWIESTSVCKWPAPVCLWTVVTFECSGFESRLVPYWGGAQHASGLKGGEWRMNPNFKNYVLIHNIKRLTLWSKGNIFVQNWQIWLTKTLRCDEATNINTC